MSVQELEARIAELEKELSIVRSSAESALSSAEKRQKTLVVKLQEKDLEVESLRIRMERISAEYTKFKDDVKNKSMEQQKSFLAHAQQVQSLRSLAAQDREWLENETQKRIAASAAQRKAAQEQANRIQRRCSAGW